MARCCHGTWRVLCRVDHANHQLLGQHHLRHLCRAHDRRCAVDDDECLWRLLAILDSLPAQPALTSPPDR